MKNGILTNVNSKEFVIPAAHPQGIINKNSAIKTILYVDCVFISKGISILLSKGASFVVSVTSASARMIPMQYATIVIVWRMMTAFAIRSEIFALRVVSRMLMSLLVQSFQSSAISAKISTNFLWIMIFSLITLPTINNLNYHV